MCGVTVTYLPVTQKLGVQIPHALHSVYIHKIHKQNCFTLSKLVKVERGFGELTATACSTVLKTAGSIKGIGIDTLVLRTMVKIFRKEGWTLNPDDRVVNSILRMVENNDGRCPCHNTSAETECPCSNYRLHDLCECGLYVKINS